MGHQRIFRLGDVPYNIKMLPFSIIRLFWLGLFPVWLVLLIPHVSMARPLRVVSLNLCTDQLLQTLADPEQIAGLSPLARDPSLSILASDAALRPRLAPSSEALMLIQPDLVLMGPYDPPLIRARLQQSGITLLTLPAWTNLPEGIEQIRSLAKTLDQIQRGESLIAEIETALHKSHRKNLDRTRTVLEIERRLYSPGHTSLISTLLTEWKIPNLSDDFGLAQGGFLALEKLVLHKPDRLIISNGSERVLDMQQPQSDDLGLALLRHPSLKAATLEMISIPARLTLCGGPATPVLIEHLSDALQ